LALVCGSVLVWPLDSGIPTPVAVPAPEPVIAPVPGFDVKVPLVPGRTVPLLSGTVLLDMLPPAVALLPVLPVLPAASGVPTPVAVPAPEPVMAPVPGCEVRVPLEPAVTFPVPVVCAEALVTASAATATLVKIGRISASSLHWLTYGTLSAPAHAITAGPAVLPLSHARHRSRVIIGRNRATAVRIALRLPVERIARATRRPFGLVFGRHVRAADRLAWNMLGLAGSVCHCIISCFRSSDLLTFVRREGVFLVVVELAIDLFGDQVQLFVARNQLDCLTIVDIEVKKIVAAPFGDFESTELGHDLILPISVSRRSRPPPHGKSVNERNVRRFNGSG
jgi:hypothetical protein